jgi:hypothetical protein
MMQHYPYFIHIVNLKKKKKKKKNIVDFRFDLLVNIGGITTLILLESMPGFNKV